ncbi:hypothetical protein [Actinomyces trachealis]|uniref:hypothetical protein n=1 Tax=Actinomyces trachealis TaxID=2763540 RepID=UPI0018C7F96B|nr:hypothetical protein [Actinomyces trachealis]
MTTTYDCTRPWREQIDAGKVEAMLRAQVPEVLERLGLERLLTVKRMIDEYVVGNVARSELVTMASHYDMGLVTPPTPLGEDPEPAPVEGDAGRDIYTAGMRGRIDDGLYDELITPER